MKCPYCNEGKSTCLNCLGEGKKKVLEPSYWRDCNYRVKRNRTAICRKCRGKGKIKCSVCKGTGIIPDKE